MAVRSGAGLRRYLLERDKGVCRRCGFDCYALEQEFRRWARTPRLRPVLRGVKAFLGIEHRKTFWDANHTLPVEHGGGCADPRTVETLCLWCHKAATAVQAFARQRDRRLEERT